MSFLFVQPWHAFLPRDGGHIIGLMGSGGKTSLLCEFAKIYTQENLPVILTTTTRTEPLEGFPTYDLQDLKLTPADNLPPVVFLKKGTEKSGKWLGLNPAEVDELSAKFPDRIIIAEVDGSAKLPLKLYKPNEPCWPERTSLAIVVMGASAVGEQLGDVLHRYGNVPFSPLGETTASTPLLWDNLLELLTTKNGYLDQVPDCVPAVLALMGIKKQDDSIGLFDFVGRAMTNHRIPLVMIGELADAPIYLQTVSRETRLDLAIILARGKSERMGQPKGLCKLPETECTFISTLCSLYVHKCMPVVVVSTEELITAYQQVDGLPASVAWEAGPSGGDTAETIRLAWQMSSNSSEPVTHLWAHPVDMPLVKSGTLDLLEQESAQSPGKIVRPVFEDQPGHPVIFPMAVLERVFEFCEVNNYNVNDMPMRDLIKLATDQGIIAVEIQLNVTDNGVVMDFDSPDQINRKEKPDD